MVGLVNNRGQPNSINRDAPITLVITKANRLTLRNRLEVLIVEEGAQKFKNHGSYTNHLHYNNGGINLKIFVV